MTETEQQKLAEFWAEKLFKPDKFGHYYVPFLDEHWVTGHKTFTSLFFYNIESAPIIAHFVQEYMEGEGFSHTHHYFKDIGYGTKNYESSFWNHDKKPTFVGGHNGENKWLANAEAARRALEKK